MEFNGSAPTTRSSNTPPGRQICTCSPTHQVADGKEGWGLAARARAHHAVGQFARICHSPHLQGVGRGLQLALVA